MILIFCKTFYSQGLNLIFIAKGHKVKTKVINQRSSNEGHQTKVIHVHKGLKDIWLFILIFVHKLDNDIFYFMSFSFYDF